MTARADELAVAFLGCRARLVRVAYAILGSHSEAEDVVSDVYLKLTVADSNDPVADVEGWAVVATARAALDVYRSARRRRETYVGPWLPEPVLAAESAADPADRVTLDDSVSYALLVVLESLSPAERTAWVLHELFAMPFPEVAHVVGRTPQAVRQLASRARRHLADHAPRLDVDHAEHERIVQRFLAAAGGGDVSALVGLLDPGVSLVSDGGGVVSSALRPVVGADRVARFVLGIAAKIPVGADVRPELVNGAPGVVVRQDGRPTSVMSLTVADGRIVRIDVVRAPAKLTGA